MKSFTRVCEYVYFKLVVNVYTVYDKMCEVFISEQIRSTIWSCVYDNNPSKCLPSHFSKRIPILLSFTKLGDTVWLIVPHLFPSNVASGLFIIVEVTPLRL